MKPKRDNKDLAIHIVNKLVDAGIIVDCTDTGNETEFNAQDIIEKILNKRFKKNIAED